MNHTGPSRCVATTVAPQGGPKYNQTRYLGDFAPTTSLHIVRRLEVRWRPLVELGQHIMRNGYTPEHGGTASTFQWIFNMLVLLTCLDR